MGKQRAIAKRMFVGIGLAAGLGACGGGGGGGTGVTFSFVNAAAALDESAAPASVQVVLTLAPTLAALTADVSVDVADLANGTATPGADYATFATETLTFPAGSVDGAVLAVALDPLDDLLVDGASETVRLRLQSPVGGGITPIALFTATLTDTQAAAVAFATATGSAPGEQGTQAIALELDCGPGVTLGVAVNVRVSDLRTGSAVPPGDYSAFAAQTVTFASGSADGALQTVNLQVTDDAMTEGDETVELGLSTPSTACTLGAIATHVLTIEDDEVGGNAAFLASEGASGTDNSLAYDESIALGTQTVGAGPNAGTLLRVANAGGQAMDLGAPSVTGAHDEDFALDIQSSSFQRASQSDDLPASAMPAPLIADAALAATSVGLDRALRLDPVGLSALRALDEVALHDLDVPGLGPVTLALTRRPLPVTADAKLVVDGVEIAGGPRVVLGDLQLWSGSVMGLPGSRVFLGLGGGGARGFIEVPDLPQRFVHIVPDAQGEVRFVSEPELAALGQGAPPVLCAGQRFAPDTPLFESFAGDEPPTSALTLSECRLAIETDYQLFQIFNSSMLLTNYVTELIGAVSDQYATDVQTTLSIAYLGIHTSSPDGWEAQDAPGADSGDVLDEFRAAWAGNWPAQADLAHFISGADLGGGVAYVSQLCNQSFGFGVSGDILGNIDWGAWTGLAAGFTWDFVVVAHELGHNFGSSHTHDYCPPLDQCYANCNGTTNCPTGTIMSYCHLCGGMNNVDLLFHPVCANLMRQRVNASCLDDAALAAGDFVQYRLRFNPQTATGTRTGTLTFTHDAPNITQPFRVQLTGTAD